MSKSPFRGFVKINSNLGYGDGLFQITGEDAYHYTVKAVAGGKTFSVTNTSPFKIYKTHTYQDAETRKETSNYRTNQAAAIGTNKRR